MLSKDIADTFITYTHRSTHALATAYRTPQTPSSSIQALTRSLTFEHIRSASVRSGLPIQYNFGKSFKFVRSFGLFIDIC